jgi:hypothetical protein
MSSPPDIYEPYPIQQPARKCDQCIDRYFPSEEKLEEHNKEEHHKGSKKEDMKQAIDDIKTVAKEAEDPKEKKDTRKTLERAL